MPPLLLLELVFFWGGGWAATWCWHVLLLPVGSPWQFHQRFLPPHPARNLLGYIIGPRRQQDHLKSTPQLTHAQWGVGCEAARSHSWLPKVNMMVMGTRRLAKNQPRWGQRWNPRQVSVLSLSRQLSNNIKILFNHLQTYSRRHTVAGWLSCVN